MAVSGMISPGEASVSLSGKCSEYLFSIPKQMDSRSEIEQALANISKLTTVPQFNVLNDGFLGETSGDSCSIAQQIRLCVNGILDTLLVTYPMGCEGLQKFISSNFGSLISKDILERVSFPSNWWDLCRSVSISVEGIEARFKNPGNLEIELHHGGQTAHVSYQGEGRSDSVHLLVNNKCQVVKVQIYKNGKRGRRLVGEAGWNCARAKRDGSSRLQLYNNESKLKGVLIYHTFKHPNGESVNEWAKAMLFKGIWNSVTEMIGMEGLECKPPDPILEPKLCLEMKRNPLRSGDLFEIQFDGQVYRITSDDSEVQIKCLNLPVSHEIRISSPSFGSQTPCNGVLSALEIDFSAPYQIRVCGDDWTFQWRSLVVAQQIRPQNIVAILYHREVSKKTLEEAQTWNGMLSENLKKVEHLFQLFCNNEEWAKQVALTLIQLYKFSPFNFEVVSHSIKVLDEARVDFEINVKGLEHLISSIGIQLGRFDPEYSTQFELEQILPQIDCIGIALSKIPTLETMLRDQLKLALDAHICQRLEVKSEKSKFNVLEGFINEFAVPIFRLLELKSDIGFEIWKEILSGCIITHLCPILEVKVKNKPTIAQLNGEVTFNLFKLFRKFQPYQTDFQSQCVTLFQDCLHIWLQTVETKASLQTMRILELERKRHGKSNWSEWCKRQDDWFQGPQDLSGVLNTCRLTWIELDWPDLLGYLKFGQELLHRLQVNIVDVYVSKFYGIIFADKEFDRHEFVIVLFTISSWGEFLNSMSEHLKVVMSRMSNSAIEESECMLDFFRNLNEAKLKAVQDIEKFIDSFLQGEQKRFQKFLLTNNLYNPEEPKNCLLGHFDTSLTFFHQHLNFHSSEINHICLDTITLKYSHMIRESFVKTFKKKIQPKLTQDCQDTNIQLFYEGLEQLLFIPDVLEFDKDHDLVLMNMFEEVKANFVPTKTLVENHFKALKQRFSTIDEEVEIRGTITICYSLEIENKSRVIQIELVNLQDVRNRTGKDVSNPRIKFTLEPCSKKDLVNIDSLIFSNTNNAIFGLSHPEQTFSIPMGNTSGPSSPFLVIELFDYSKAKTHKFFRGMNVLHIPSTMETVRETVSLDLYQVPKDDERSPVFEKLLQRRTWFSCDWLANHHVKRHLHRLNESNLILEESFRNRNWNTPTDT